jgi:hypothetical protein
MPETLYLCINIIDRFLSVRVVSLAKLQLVGITCLFITAKVEEIVSPSISHFLYCADSSYAEILQVERCVLKALDWNLSYPNPIHFLGWVGKADEYDVKARTIAEYLLEIVDPGVTLARDLASKSTRNGLVPKSVRVIHFCIFYPFSGIYI